LCDIIVMNVHAPSEDKSGHLLRGTRMFIPKISEVLYKNSVRYFNSKLGKEYILKHSVGTEILHEVSNDNRVGVVNLPHKGIQLSTVQCSASKHSRIHLDFL